MTDKSTAPESAEPPEPAEAQRAAPPVYRYVREPDEPPPVVESATPTQRTQIAVAAATTSAAAASTSAAAATTAVAAGQVPERVQLADKIGEAIGIIVLGTLAWHRPELGTLACWLIAGIVSGGTLTRTLGPRVGLPALGAAGLTVLSLGSVLSELMRGAGRGRATAPQLAGVLLAATVVALAAAGFLIVVSGGLR